MKRKHYGKRLKTFLVCNTLWVVRKNKLTTLFFIDYMEKIVL